MAKRGKNTKRKRRQVLYVLVLLTAVWLSYSLFDFWEEVLPEKNRFVHYPHFGIDIPLGYSLHGIDVSRYQGTISWRQVKSMQDKDVKLGFAFIKATEGLTKTDRCFKRNWKTCREMKIPRGAYHFYLANKSGKEQARNFIKAVKLQPGDLPPVVDIEHLYGASPQAMRGELLQWLRIIENHYHVKPILYTYVSFYEHYLGEDFDEYPLWIAHYKQKEKPRIERDWLFWQFDETGRVNGILSNTDFNVFNGDSAMFKAMLVQQPE